MELFINGVLNGLFNKKEKNKISVIPDHVGIIMDGNGRWAKKMGLPRTVGHTAGAKNFRKIVKYCNNIGIKYTTVFAFSTENWKRPQDEINSLMNIFRKYLEEAISDFQSENIRVIFLGDKSAFSDDIIALIEKVECYSKNKDGMTLNIAMNYGGRDEIVNASKMIAREVANGNLKISDICEDTFSGFLYNKGQPDVDLVIRTSGEFRISNFLLWQSAYAEYIVTDVLWPDFKPADIDKALEFYSKRVRRFGGVL